MTRLVATELRRFFARRTMRMLVIAALALVALINVVQFVRASPPSSTPRSSFVREFPNNVPVPGLVFTQPDRRPRVGSTFEGTIRGTSMALVVLGFLLGATFLAADYGTSLGTQLLFEPRRRVLLAAKWIAAGIGSALIAAVILAAAGVAQYLISALRGFTDGVDAAWFAHRGVDILRGASATALAAMLAVLISAFTRRTVATVITLFGMLLGLRFLESEAWGRAIVRVTPTNSLWGVAFGSFDSNNRTFFGGLHTMAGAWSLTLVWAAATLVIGMWWFDRQEIR